MSLRDLENATAETLLNAIKDMAPGMGTAGGLLELSNAYAAVVDKAPGPRTAPPKRIR